MDLIALLPQLEHLGQWGYWLAFALAYCESVAIVGSFIPGTTLTVLIGFLSAHGYLDLGDLIWFTAIGAILGDTTSYYLGTKGTHWFSAESRFLKLSHLDRGQRFLEKHGGKSIFIGRFVGPVRAMVPFVAGLTGMDRKKFFFWNVIGGFTWSIAHLLLGYFAGDLLKTFKVVERWSLGATILVAAVVFTASLIGFYRRRKKVSE